MELKIGCEHTSLAKGLRRPPPSLLGGSIPATSFESQTTGVVAMNHVTAELDQTDEDILNEVSDERLEAAAGGCIGGQFVVTAGPTIMMGGCC
jgi:hypothetical protein